MISRDSITASTEERWMLSRLEKVLSGEKGGGRAYLVARSGEEVELPESVCGILARVARELSEGNGVAVLPVEAELTTRQAAEILGVSRPHVIKLMEEERAIPFTKRGTHRRARLNDVLTYKEKRDAGRLAALDEMAREAQELGLYD